jgi:hypothetical protein
MRTLLITAGIGASLALGACGGSDSKARTYDQARADLIKDCINGKESDRKLCTCTADELKKKGYTTAAKLDKANDDVKAGKTPPDVLSSITTCSGKK